MKHNNLISINDITKSEMLEVFELADCSDKLFSEYKLPLAGHVLGTFFFQTSTRTQFSFQSAFIKLGGNYIGCSDINQTRCGPPYYESMEDFAKITSNYCDIIVMRSNDENSMNTYVKNVSVPIISAGCGRSEHPTQALVDLYILKKIFGTIDNNTILIIGTPEQRTINSLLLGLNNWTNIEVLILCQDNQAIKESIAKQLTNVSVKLYTSWSELIESNKMSTISTIYIGEIYHDAFGTKDYTLTMKILKEHFNKDVVILSPLPRTHELNKDVDTHIGAKYFLQAHMGLYVRAGLFLKYFI